ncbi:hypothetical protein [Schleiferilactobacillus perolens]|uniref:Uncharacterized protein n=1 Tax=Schleiferilactobacillus perolens DSM 12744 TaxID=1423792 RepID=A0A0R1MUQ0_9LACO|nr:hypothetical protein [Schleiferilactobacillus perolens]KRL11904.1 hypothetical protein FD09_GL000512 [Schleiferilactobacillus perolens DSM 12744]
MFVIEKVVEDMPDSVPLMEMLNELFYLNATYNGSDLVVGNGDEQLIKIIDTLKRTIQLDPDFKLSEISVEKLNMYVNGLVSYGIMKCKVLINPNQGDEGNAVIGSK